jgi:hypothetical protein
MVICYASQCAIEYPVDQSSISFRSRSPVRACRALQGPEAKVPRDTSNLEGGVGREQARRKGVHLSSPLEQTEITRPSHTT